MRTKIIHFFVAVMGFLALCSCDKSGLSPNDGKVSSSSIKFGKVQVSFPADTKADSSGPRKVGEVNDGDVSFTVEETVSSIGGYQTKADATTTASLRGFNVEGYLDPEIQQKEGADDADKNNLHFIDGDNVTGSGTSSLWTGNFTGQYMWRFGTHHHFWATPNNLSNLTIDNPFTSASFSYTASGDEDVILAYTNQYYGKDEDPESTKDPVLHLTFNHALAAVTLNSENLIFKRKDLTSGALDDPGNYNGQPRCEISRYEIRNLMDTGDCVTDGTNFSWSNLSASASPVVVSLLSTDNKTAFMMPQTHEDGVILRIDVLDRQRELSRPFVFEATGAQGIFGDYNWLAGHEYNYNFSGRILVPKLPEGTSGFDASFFGQDFQNKLAIDNVTTKYVKKVRLSWEGLPGGNSGNGTYAFVGWTQNGASPVESDFLSGNTSPNTSNSHVLFVYDFKNNRVLKGTVSGTTCSCEFELPTNYDFIDIFVLYKGANNSGTCNWVLHNLKMEIIEWR